MFNLFKSKKRLVQNVTVKTIQGVRKLPNVGRILRHPESLEFYLFDKKDKGFIKVKLPLDEVLSYTVKVEKA